MNRLGEAVDLYNKALEADPEFPEACFNLTRSLEKPGNMTLARTYWRRYLELDPAGEWSEILKKRLDEE